MCSIKLDFVNVDTGENITLRDTDLTIEETNITFSILEQLRDDHYRITVMASNIVGSVTSQINISKNLCMPLCIIDMNCIRYS